MRVLVVGQGGREHAIVRALSYSMSVEQIHCVPGSFGMAQNAICHFEISSLDSERILTVAQRNQIDLVVIGPESSLQAGVADRLREAGLAVFGPNRAAAQLETSKVFAKEFMKSAGIPTARFEVVKSVAEVKKAAVHFKPPFILKADGLAAGKGVFICDTQDELLAAAEDLFVKKSLRDAGERAVIEEFLPGRELSFLTLVSDSEYATLPLAQDYKRLKTGNVGPNTGGMGCIAPIQIDADLRRRIEEEIVRPTLAELATRSLSYRGVLYFGLMIRDTNVNVLEFNCRFGDPEAQVILPLVNQSGGDWGEKLRLVALGKMPTVDWNHLYSACLVLAAEGYPEKPIKDVTIKGDLSESSPSAYFLHAGTAQLEGRWVTAGGRVLNSIGIGSSLPEALRLAQSQAERASWPGMQFRTDIGSNNF